MQTQIRNVCAAQIAGSVLRPPAIREGAQVCPIAKKSTVAVQNVHTTALILQSERRRAPIISR